MGVLAKGLLVQKEGTGVMGGIPRAMYAVKDYGTLLGTLSKFKDFRLVNMGDNGVAFYWLRNYPKEHWSPLKDIPGAKECLGNVFLSKENLVIEVKNEKTLAQCRRILEHLAGNNVLYRGKEYVDPLEIMEEGFFR